MTYTTRSKNNMIESSDDGEKEVTVYKKYIEGVALDIWSISKIYL